MTALQSVKQYRALWLEPLSERWEKRAAIMEYEGGLSHEEAEWQALLCMQEKVQLGGALVREAIERKKATEQVGARRKV